MSKEKILQAALCRFTSQGYDNTSVAQIAQDVNIRKPSLYAHFSDKWQIFTTLLIEAFQRENDFILHLHNNVQDVKKNLKAYLLAIPERYETDPYYLFWLRVLYFPPVDAKEDISCYDRDYARLIDNSLDELILYKLAPEACRLGPDATKNILICILRGLHTELLYKGITEIKPRINAACQTIDLLIEDYSA